MSAQAMEDKVAEIQVNLLEGLREEHANLVGEAKAAAVSDEDAQRLRGFDEVGVFWDWCSLFQKDEHGRRTREEQKS